MKIRSKGAMIPATRGFTLIELLVVILIILLVSAVALPTVLPAINHRQVSEAARVLQGALVGARDKAIHDGRPSGIRLLPDAAFPITWTASNTINPYQILAYNRVVPIDPAPEYSEGYCTPYTLGTRTYFGANLTVPGNVTTGYYQYALMLLENPVNPRNGAPNPPTSWFWNVRVGDKLQLNNSGPWYTVIGPMTITPQQGNSEMFVNVGPPNSLASFANLLPSLTYNGTTQPVEFLYLVNGKDDNNNGWIDEGFDGIDNDGDETSNGTLIDEFTCNISPSFGEWEQEAWSGSVQTHTTVDVPYTIRRRPAPAPNAREVALPTSMVIDATTLFLNQRERSRLPIDLQTRYSGYIDILVNPDGTVLPTTTYSSASSFSMDQAFYHFWLAERQDLAAVRTSTTGTTTTPVPIYSKGTLSYYLPIAQPGGSNPNNYPGPYLKGDYSVLTLSTRTGQIVVNANPAFLDSSGAYNATYPFIPAEQGVSGGP